VKIGEIDDNENEKIKSLFLFSLCSNGCLQCNPTSKNCSICEWSEWTPYGVCSNKCNGTQTRYRSRSCDGSTPEIDYENKTCSTNETSYKKGCALCSCDTTTGQEKCQIQCAITPDVCSNLTNDPLATYTYILPTNGECCGSCNRTNSTCFRGNKKKLIIYFRNGTMFSTRFTIRTSFSWCLYFNQSSSSTTVFR
jgi:hypothetical protein